MGAGATRPGAEEEEPHDQLGELTGMTGAREGIPIAATELPRLLAPRTRGTTLRPAR